MFFEKNRGGSLKETVLWTNPSPTISFGYTLVTLSDDFTNYKFIKITYYKDTNGGTLYSSGLYTPDAIKTFYGTPAGRGALAYTETSSLAYVRNIIYSGTDTELQFGNGLKVNAAGTAPSMLIPYQIIGLK